MWTSLATKSPLLLTVVSSPSSTTIPRLSNFTASLLSASSASSPLAANSSLILSSAIPADASSECRGSMITLLFASFKMYVYRYDVHAHLIELNLSLGKECFESNISDCAFWGNSVVCITEANDIFYIADFKNPIAVKLADPGLLEPPRCIAVIEPQYTVSGNIEVLLGVGDGSEEYDAAVLAVEEDGVQRLGVGML